MQLWGLLESMPGGNIYATVLYHANPEYRAGYDECSRRFKHVEFIEQRDTLINEYIRITSESSHDIVGTITDDCLFHKTVRLNINEIHDVMVSRDVFSFSLRLGRNTIVQDLHGHLQPCLRNEYEVVKRTKYLVWDYSIYHPLHNYGYPAGMDGVFFLKEDLLKLHSLCKVIKGRDWSNFREWESLLCTNVARVHYTKKNMASLEYSVLVNIPANSIQDPPIPIGYACRVDGMEMQRLFQSGHRINLKETFAGVPIHACHQEIPLKFSKLSLTSTPALVEMDEAA